MILLLYFIIFGIFVALAYFPVLMCDRGSSFYILHSLSLSIPATVPWLLLLSMYYAGK